MAKKLKAQHDGQITFFSVWLKAVKFDKGLPQRLSILATRQS